MELGSPEAINAADSYGMLSPIVRYIHSGANSTYLAFLGLSAILNKRNVRIAADTTDAEEGMLEFITPPEDLYVKGKRGIAFTA